MRFIKSLFGASKDKASETALNALANAAPDLMSEAGIREQELLLDDATKAFVEAKADYDKEKREADEAEALYNQRLQAAETISAQLEAADEADKPAIEASLGKLLTTIEEHAPEVEREVQEAADAKVWMDEAQAVMKEMSDDLKNARKDLEAAKRDQETAKKQQQRAERLESRAKELAGIKKGASGLNTAAAAMRKNAEETRKKADAATLKANLLKSSSAEQEDDNIAKAMAAASGSPAAGGSMSDRLAALKKK